MKLQRRLEPIEVQMPYDYQGETNEGGVVQIKDPKKLKWLYALIETKGNVTAACKILDTSNSTHHYWMRVDPIYAEAVQAIKEVTIDGVENKLLELIEGIQIEKGEDDEGEPIVYKKEPNLTAIIFYLKTQAQHRGYIEKQHVQMDANIKQAPFPGINLDVEDIEVE